MKIAYIAYSCSPYSGSEDKIGWNIPYYSSKTNEKILVITKEEQKKYIEKFIQNNKNDCKNIKFMYVDIPKIYKIIFKGPLYSARLGVWHSIVYKKLKKICIEKQIEIIHQITPVEFRAIGKYYKIKNIKFVVGPLGGGEYIPNSLSEYKTNKKMELIRAVMNWITIKKIKFFKILDKCDCVLFANNETKNYFYDIGKGKVMTEIGIDKKELAQKNKFDNKITFLVVGRLINRKGHFFLLDTLEKIPSNYDYIVKIVGDGYLYEQLEKRISNSDILRKRVILIKNVSYDKMKNIYLQSDVLILPSLRETTGSVILEAMSKGLPVISINAFGGKVIINNSCGYLYYGKNKNEMIESLKECIMNCITDKELLQKKSKNAYKESKQYLWTNKIIEYNKIYKSLFK